MTKDEYDAITALNLAVMKLTLLVAEAHMRAIPVGSALTGALTINTQAVTDLLKEAQEKANRAYRDDRDDPRLL